MLPYYIRPDGTGGATGPPTFPGNQNTQLLYCFTQRDMESGAGDNTATSVRESVSIYARGLKERILMRTDTSVSWQWRRIVFSCKGLGGIINTTRFGNETVTQGWTRTMLDLTGFATERNALESVLFRGSAGVDWNDVATAKPDTMRVSVHYDRTRILSSGNANGRYFKQSQWIPINKNIVYANDEVGEDMDSASLSTTAKAGAGDFFIWDLFTCSSGSTNDHLIFEPEATFYWHEK